MPLSDIQTVIVQTGGRGSRLGSLTNNRPKCLLSVDGKPLLSRISECFPGAQVVVIGDYQYEALKEYLSVLGTVRDYRLVRAEGSGDVAGIDVALRATPDGPHALVWSDLLLGELPELDVASTHYIGLSRSFECRWFFDGSRCVESPSSERGVLGFYTFTTRDALLPLPENGSFLAALNQRGLWLTPTWLDHTTEIGDRSVFLSLDPPIGRPYNRLNFTEHSVTKACIDPDYHYKLPAEAIWYEQVRRLGFVQVPRVLATEPLTLERIERQHPFELDLNSQAKQKLLDAIVESLETLHGLDDAPFNHEACCAAHLEAPFRAIQAFRKMLPTQPELVVNGRRCLNPLANPSLIDSCRSRFASRAFCVIHGERTFSNTIAGDDGSIWFIDPAASYGSCPQPLGNPLYDWTKLYYSITGGYDVFNRKRFECKISSANVTLDIEPSGWESITPAFEERFSEKLHEIRLMHALELFLLAAHSPDDYGAILAAFFRGDQALEDAR